MNKPLALVIEQLLHRGPVGGSQRGHCFTGDFERKRDFVLSEDFFLLENPRDM
jgi:mRNA-degrading endonuclease YafQ of YafQ-DinJ toxin-antitoxin module